MKIVRTVSCWLALIVVVVVGYYVLTAAAIRFCVADLSRPVHGCACLLWDTGDETRFLISMGTRAIPVIRRQLARSDLKMQSRIWFAWILSSIGDHSQFHTFVDGLASGSSGDQGFAVGRMRDFPDQCALYLPEILAVRGQRTSQSYWSLIENAGERAHLGDRQLDRINQIIFLHSSDKSPLTKQERHEILALLKSNN